jgi:hypothetical protein
MAIVIWLPRGFQLGKFVTTDEVAWLPRSANFYYALGQRDFAATQMNEAPGVTLLWTETAAYFLDFPEYRGFGQGLLDKYKFYENILLSHGVRPMNILITSRTIMVLIHTLVLALTFFIARRIFGALPAIVGFLLIAFDPYHTAITRLSHLDGPMTNFLYLSIVAFLAYLLVKRNIWYLVVSAIAGGLAVLSKIPAWVGLPTIGILILVDYFIWNKPVVPGRRAAADFLKRSAWPLLIWGLVFLATIVITYPAMWVRPFEAFKALVLSPLGYAAKIVSTSAPAADTSIETAEVSFVFGSQPLQYIFRYPNYYFQLASPVILAGLMIAFLTYLFKMGVMQGKVIRSAVQGLLIFALLYTLVMTIPPKSSPKYYLPVFVVADMIAGIGWVAGVQWLVSKFHFGRQKLVIALLLLGVVSVQAFGALKTFPYYFTFYNPLAGGGHIFGSGEGLDQAAEYLNQKPEAKSLKVLSWYGIGPFSYFFNGITETIPVGEPPWGAENFQNLSEMDYLVTYQNQWMRGIPAGLFDFLAGVEPEYTVILNGAEFAKIYSVEQLFSR